MPNNSVLDISPSEDSESGEKVGQTYGFLADRVAELMSLGSVK